MLSILQNTFKILWLYILCGALVSIVWFVNWRAYFPITAMEMMQIEGVIYAVIVGNILYFSYKGIAEPQSFLQKSLLSLVAIITLSLSGLLAYKGWLHLEKQKVFFSLKYLKWLGEILMIFSLPAFVSVLATFVALKNSLFSLGAQKLVEDEPYGSARLCSAQEAISQNDKNGLPIGRILSSVKGDDIKLIDKIKQSKVGEIFRYDPIHSFLIAPTRSGKGVGFVIPTLLDYEGPVICIDPKSAENYTVTSRHRSKAGTRKVFAFDTCNATGKPTAKINVFDFIDPSSPKFIDDVKFLATSLFPLTGNSHQDFFIVASQDIFMCLFSVVARFEKQQRNLKMLYDLLMQPSEGFIKFLERTSKATDDPNGTSQRLANKILATDPRERSGGITGIKQGLGFLETPLYRSMVEETNFDLNDIFENKADLYFCIPSKEIKGYGKYFIRLVLPFIVNAIKELPHPPSKKVLFLIDEMAGIGRIEAVDDILLEGSGYGIKLVGIAQTLSSLKKIYPEEFETITSSSLLMFLGLKSVEDREYVSRFLGHKTVFSESDSTNERDSKSQTGHTKSAVKREILTPNELGDLGKDYMMAFVDGSKPLVLKKLCYYLDKEFKGKFDKNNFH